MTRTPCTALGTHVRKEGIERLSQQTDDHSVLTVLQIGLPVLFLPMFPLCNPFGLLLIFLEQQNLLKAFPLLLLLQQNRFAAQQNILLGKQFIFLYMLHPHHALHWGQTPFNFYSLLRLCQHVPVPRITHMLLYLFQAVPLAFGHGQQFQLILNKLPAGLQLPCKRFGLPLGIHASNPISAKSAASG